MTKNIITQTAPNLSQTPRVDLWKKGFDSLVWTKGQHVTWEKAIKCPCKQYGGPPDNSCQNCRGLGWIWTELIDTRMVIQSINMNTKIKSWSIELLGTASITALAENNLSFMDRVTITNSIAIFQEVLYPVAYEGEYLLDKNGDNLATIDGDLLLVNGKAAMIFTIYPVKEIEYIAVYVDNETALRKLETTEYTVSNNYIWFAEALVGKGITIRYTHSPQFLILDLTREMIQSEVVSSSSGHEELKNFPVHAIAKRSQYVFDAENTTSTLMVHNNIE